MTLIIPVIISANAGVRTVPPVPTNGSSRCVGSADPAPVEILYLKCFQVLSECFVQVAMRVENGSDPRP